MTWSQAQAEAVNRGGNLVILNSAAEEQLIKQLFGESEAFWIGLSDSQTEGTYRWVNGDPLTYTNWLPGEPNNWGGDEDYIAMNFGAGSQWNDYPIGFQLRGVIEFPPSGGQISLESSVVSVNEADGTVTLRILRQNGSAGTVSVDFRTTPGTATGGVDYTAVSGTATFAPGETVKTITIPITNDFLAEGSETFGVTIDNLVGQAQLLAPRTATVTIIDDEVPLPDLFNYTTMNDAGVFLANGSATIASNVLRLTAATNQTGSAFLRRPLAVDANTSFASRFSFRIPGGTAGGEGLVFVMQNASTQAAAIGGAGAGMGYTGIGSSLAISFDTVRQTGEPSANFVGLLTNGSGTPIATAAAPVDLNSGSTVFAWVEYNGTTNTLNVFVAGTSVKPSAPLLTRSIDLPAFVGNRAFLGMTAATGTAVNTHEILSWGFASNNQLQAAPGPVNVSAQQLYAGLIQPTAMEFSPDGRNLYISEQRGIVRVARDGALLATPFLDFRDRVNGTRDRGLLDVAVHPNFPATPYLYLIYTYDPPEVYQNTTHALAGPDRNGNRAGRITRVTADASTNFTTVVPNSEVVLVGGASVWANFNAFANSTSNFSERPAGIRTDGTNIDDFIATDSESHTVGALEFGPDGKLYATIGDGTSYNQVDPRTVRVQDVNNLSGKVLRIDPITGAGLADNPFWNGNANSNRSKVWQLGVRNAFRMGIDQSTGRVYLGDVGWYTWEEVNTGPAGANFGWPYYEGDRTGSARTPGYQNLTQAQAFYAAGTPVNRPLLAYNHSTDGMNAIVMGDVYRGTAYPEEFRGNIFFNDLGQGIVRRAVINADGSVGTVSTFATGAQYVTSMKVSPADGMMYYVDLDNGTVGRWRVN
jgi:glucose/arabinose dehydrogenase